MKKILIYFGTILLIISFFMGGYLYAGIKFAKPHYHSNFKMFINGELVDFTDDKYSEDVGKCKLDGEMSPKDRVHLHENNPDVIHIHHEGVAWGHFFLNNNFIFGEDYLITDSGEIFNEDEENKLIFILNGKIISNPYNRMIKSEDRLLINYGNETEDFLINERFKQVLNNSGEYNNKYDPGTCSGTNENSILFLIKQLLHIKH